MRLIRSVRPRPAHEGRANGNSHGHGAGELLIDARTLQDGRHDGTARHAAAVLESMLARRKNWQRIRLLIDSAMPALPDRLAGGSPQIGMETVTPELRSKATAFLQLQPFHDLRHSETLDELLATPWIRTATIWLDAIAGTYPRHFLTTPWSFFSYQRFIERLRYYDHILALSEASKEEVLPLLGDSTSVTVTGCRNPLRTYKYKRPHLSGLASHEARVTLFGNTLPHKNLLGGLFAFAYAYFRYKGYLQLDVVANLTDDQVREARSILSGLDTALPSVVTFHRRISDLRLSQIVTTTNVSVIPSFHEGFSLPVLESFAYGIPIVASEIPAHRELLGKDYPLAPPDDPAALGKNLLNALNNPSAWTICLKNSPISRQESQFDSALDLFVKDFMALKILEPCSP